MYGLWLYKELKTEYGFAKVEVFRKGYTASAIEIGALVGDSLTLALENLSSITDPIGKSVCSFEIYDTNQVEYDDLFTPDATAYKVVVSTKLDGGNYTTRWSGYVTPDFFAESLSYRTPISISARDNIGYLNDVDFDLDVATITVRELIVAAFNRIAEDYPMSLVFETTKQTEEGILAIDATISTALLKDKSWYDAIETILHDLGMQMRWVDNNTIAVLDVSQLGEKFGLQKFNFIDKSGYREILPAWRELNQKQDYGLRENFFEGWLKNNALAFVKSQSVKLPIPIGQAGAGSSATMKYYAPNNWGVAGNTYTINTEDFAYLGAYGQATTPFGKRIYFTGVDKADTTIAQNYMSWRQNVYKSNDRMQITFKAFNSLLGTSHNSPDTLLAYNPAERFLGINLGLTTGDYIQLGLKVNLFLHVGTKTYIMRETWEEISGAETSSLYFVLDKMGDISGDNIPKEQEISIGIGNIPASGQLELRIYGFTLEDKKNLQEDAKLATYDWLRMVSYIDDVTYSYAESNKKTGVVSGVEIASLHNIKASEDYTFGQITLFSGGINAYAGGLYKANGDELVGFRRDASSTTYPLLELVGREIIHFNKKNYTKLSGTAKNLAAEPLMFNKLLVYKGKNYLPYACSLDVISNTMNITTMQEVEPYATQSFAEIKSELVTGGGATVSGGNNTALQYSAEVGNAKRISELNNASESEKKESYIIVDNASWNESKKVPLNEMEGLNEAELTEFLTANKYATQPWVSGIAKGLADDLANRVLIADFEKLEGTVNGNYQSINILNGKVGTLEGYFTKGVANDSAKLGGQLPSYYATASALDTTNSNLSALTTRVGNTEDAITSIQNTYVDKGSAQTITGVKTFQNGLKIGDIKLEWDSANQALKIIGNAYVTELFSMGKISESGSGGGGTASAAVRIMLGETPYDAVNGVVNLPAYPSLNGYATEGWVGANYQPKGNYLTLVGWGDINNKPTTALGYDITDVITTNGFSLRAESNRTWGTLISANGYTTRYWLDSVSGGGIGISDYADKTYIQINGEYYANEGRSLVLHTANYGDYALPLSGGKISGTTNTPLVVGTSATKEVGIRLDMLDGNKAWIGYTPTTGVYLYHYNGSHILGIKDDGTPNYNGNTLIHSGNIGSYTSGNSNAVGGYGADSLWRSDGGVWNPSANIKLEASSNGQEWSFDIARNGYTGCYWHVWDSNWGSMLLVNADDGSVKAPYGFVGNLSGNASSATKLQTARSIWGQSFDGTGNLDGVFTLYYDNNTRATGIEI